jgi:hypothetical protein
VDFFLLEAFFILELVVLLLGFGFLVEEVGVDLVGEGELYDLGEGLKVFKVVTEGRDFLS